jgi:tRNA (mo5U34)-methyltransferase
MVGEPLPELLARAREHTWYHTFDLPDGTTTPGYYDERGVASQLPIPPSLEGMRCLDVASADGFFAFEMARRGAKDVVSIDLMDTTKQDWQGPPGQSERRRKGTGNAQRNFELMREIYGAANIQRVDASVYDISAETFGTFDYVFMGNILIHVADPGRVLRAVRSVVAGEVLSLEVVALFLTLISPKMPVAQLHGADEPRWWTHNAAGHRRLIEAGGLRVVDRGRVWQPFGRLVPRFPRTIRLPPRYWLYWLTIRRTGCPSQWIRAVPRELPAD